jgi:hypothetical protein
MTPPDKIRAAVYAGTIGFVFVPVLMLAAIWGEPPRSPTFILGAVILLLWLVIARWDLAAYSLSYLFLLAFLVIAYSVGGWVAPAVALVFLVMLEILFRRSGPEKPLQLVFPLNHGAYCVAHGGDFQLLNHHRKSKSQRYALDIVKLNMLGMRARGVYPKRLAEYAIFGDVVYSPAAGMVTAIVNDLPDLPPGEMDRQHVAGNHIVIRLDDTDVYIGLAHLMQTSIQVKPGERIVAGQVLARVGNSGNTTEPHLHIHAKCGGRPDSMLDGRGVPMRFNGRWLIRNSLVRRHSEAADT